MSIGHVPQQSTYGEVIHNKTIKEVDVGISEVAEIDVLFNWGLFGIQLLETWGR